MTFPLLIGATGRRYLFKQLIQERPHLGRVWLATSGQDKFVLKDIPNAIFANFNEDIHPQLRESRSTYLRLPCDTIPDQNILVYKYFTSDFLSLVRKQVPIQARKQVLKASLQGIAELHSHDIVHLDIKPDNIMVNYRGNGSETVIEQVQITDFENAAYLPEGKYIKGMLPGNDYWRSPEGHFRGILNKPTDIFSFAVVCIYAMTGQVIFEIDEDHESQGNLPAIIHLQRQVAFFGDYKGVEGLKRHVGDQEINCKVLSMLWDNTEKDGFPYKPFLEWPSIDDEVFKDLILRMTCLDPRNRATAEEILEHGWFAGCGIE
ncbi:hypothetical protein FQN50_003750 [Emmonsiellopsis sp. PD_5]|nr:hypothetical protein FQN50_003750 [Emmonsiellopsis sp. PD_5]